ncbi:protein translocase subunit SecD [Magnetospirillum molischianum]|uniref:Multifunctional fusion protein n=1 Tax=Magnetospirillum molischianum DSM 120 TaxID=1150626 RepID=H8FUE2_MAGML|nr:protein translocase subunit SecD [Magnetospirillum molischianum]CCG41980.1 Protein-export membrane protein secD [Magnetospirillum molischianum DSM 120]
MLYFSKVKTTLIWAICALGVLMSIPNFVKPEAMPSWLPLPRTHLGLDLQGGAYLLLEVDSASVTKERLDGTVDGVRSALREAGIGYRNLGAGQTDVSFFLIDRGRESAMRGALRPLLDGATPGVRDFDLEITPEHQVRLTLSEGAIRAAQSRAVEQSVEIVRRRIDETGVNEPVVARQGQNRILVQLPGIDDPGRIKRLLGQTAKMSFHLLAEEPGTPGSRLLPSADPALAAQKMPVRTKIEVDGARLRDAAATMDSRAGEWVVTFAFDSVGAKRFADITSRNVGRPFAIVLDGKVISAPVIREPITGGQGQISGNFSAQSAHDLAVLLRAGALPAPLTVVEERTVGPDLGADAIRAGLIACVVGFVLVVGFMAVSYGLFGLFANIALLFNLALTLAALSALGATLTLPGIAGILLTLGMSVDANILINERIREEARKGASPSAAMEAGFRRAFSTIVDSNLTTLIKMLLLYAVGTGTVKGFAVTISLGIITSMFTATIVARWLMVAWFRAKRPKVLLLSRLLRLVPDETRIPFMKGRNVGLIVSLILSLASVGLVFSPGLNYGVDFAGGTVVEIRTEGPADFPALRNSMGQLGLGQVSLQQFGAPTDLLIRFERQPGGDPAQQRAVSLIEQKLAADFPDASIRRVESVGASVSAELFQSGMLALALAAMAMLIYITIRFEWQFGVGAVVTMILDVTKTVGFFALTGMQFNLTAIAAILTIMGYSINDKVVVYDRVRENLRRYRRMPLRELIDLSINETMSRTVGTSVALFLATVPLALFGGEAIREFALVLLFGVVLATSSSIFIAAPILLFLGEHRLRRSPESENIDVKQSSSEETS